MKLTPCMDLSIFIKQDGKQLLTDTRAVAIAFGKQHAHVMRTVKAKLSSKRPCIAEHARSNFGASSYVDSIGRRRPMYRMTAKGLTALTLAFTGEDAEEVRIRFVDAFEELALRLARAEETISEQLHALTRRETPSIVKGQVGSALMHDRRREKPAFKAERDFLESLQQPQLAGLLDDDTDQS